MDNEVIAINRSKITSIFKKAPFLATITIVSFVLFIGVYLFVTVRAIEPYYLEGLIFALPFVCFGVITLLAANGILDGVSSYIITIILIILLGFAMLLSFTLIAIDAATTETTNIDKYERVLRITGYPDDQLTKHFPEKIPEDAKNIAFSYNPAFLQGGEVLSLKFEIEPDFVDKYIKEISNSIKWKGKSNDIESERKGIFSGTFIVFGYNRLPEDFTIYVMESRASL